MSDRVVFKPGRKSLALGVFVLALMIALSYGILQSPSRDGANVTVAYVCLGSTVLFAGLFLVTRTRTRIILENEGIVCVRQGQELRLEWNEIANVSGKVVHGNKSDREYVILDVPNLEHKIAANSSLKVFRSSDPGLIYLSTSLYDEGTGVIVEAIQQRMHPEAPAAPTAAPQTKGLQRNVPSCPPVSHRAWTAILAVAMFGTFAGFGIYTGITRGDQVAGEVLAGIFGLVFVPLTIMGVQILVLEKVSMNDGGLSVHYPGLTMRVSWPEITGIRSSGSTSVKILIIELQDFESFRHSLPAAQERRMINLLAGRGQGLPIKRDLMPVSLDRIAAEISERAGL